MPKPIGLRLEQYTIQRSQEVLLVHLTTSTGEPDTVMIYGGFSSSLMMPTAFDPEVPVIAADSTIEAIDRLASPYNPSNPVYLQSGITQAEMEQLLFEMNL